VLIELNQIDDVCVMRFEGRFSTGTDPDYLLRKSDEIKRLACGKVLVDFRDVISVGSTAIGYLVAIYSSVTKNPDGPRVREVLDLTRLSSILPMAGDMASGMAALRGTASAHGQR